MRGERGMRGGPVAVELREDGTERDRDGFGASHDDAGADARRVEGEVARGPSVDRAVLGGVEASLLVGGGAAPEEELLLEVRAETAERLDGEEDDLDTAGDRAGVAAVDGFA